MKGGVSFESLFQEAERQGIYKDRHPSGKSAKSLIEEIYSAVLRDVSLPGLHRSLDTRTYNIAGRQFKIIRIQYYSNVSLKGIPTTVYLQILFPPAFPLVPPIFSIINWNEGQLALSPDYFPHVLPDRSIQIRLYGEAKWKTEANWAILFEEQRGRLEANFPFSQSLNPRLPLVPKTWDSRLNDPSAARPFEIKFPPVLLNSALLNGPRAGSEMATAAGAFGTIGMYAGGTQRYARSSLLATARERSSALNSKLERLAKSLKSSAVPALEFKTSLASDARMISNMLPTIMDKAAMLDSKAIEIKYSARNLQNNISSSIPGLNLDQKLLAIKAKNKTFANIYILMKQKHGLKKNIDFNSFSSLKAVCAEYASAEFDAKLEELVYTNKV